VSGGSRPVWSRDGKELFYFSAYGKVTGVAVKTGAGFEAGAPRVVFETRFPTLSHFDVTPDGRRFLMVYQPEARNVQMTVVVNWNAGVKR
jgi:Tol biopolymer transport system component